MNFVPTVTLNSSGETKMLFGTLEDYAREQLSILVKAMSAPVLIFSNDFLIVKKYKIIAIFLIVSNKGYIYFYFWSQTLIPLNMDFKNELN